MIRFFIRLAIAALADWFTWQISTPEMRFQRAMRKQIRPLLAVIDAAVPAWEEFYRSMQRAADQIVDWSQTSQEFLQLAEECRNVKIDIEVK